MEVLKSILNVLNEFATNIPLDTILTAGIISPVLLGLKKFLHLDNEKVVFGLLVLICGVTAAVGYLLSAPTNDPSIIALRTAVIAFTTQPIYYLIVKPLVRRFRAYVEKAVQYNLDKMTATEPASGVTLGTSTDEIPADVIAEAPKMNVIQDFSSKR